MRYLTIFLIVFITFNSCVEPISFIVQRTGGQLIVDGRFTNLEGPEIINLGISANKSRIPEALSGAQITIFDDAGNSGNFTENSKMPGQYLLEDEEMEAQVGRAYFIEVNVPERGVYRTNPEVLLPEAASLDTIYYDFSVRREVNENSIVSENQYINAYIDVTIKPNDQTPFYMRWDVEEVFLVTPTDFPDPFGYIPPPCYVFQATSDINVNLFDGTRNQATNLNRLQVGSQLLDFSFREKHYFTVYQRTISQEAFEYWRKASQLLLNVGSIFDTPPAPIPGNVYNVDDSSEDVLGYFEVASSSLKRFRTFRYDIPKEQILECEYKAYKQISNYPSYCLNCQSLRNSTLERPDFF